MFAPKTSAGIGLALACLCLLGTLPIIANGRPPGFDALAFAVMLSFWQSVCGVPLVAAELRRGGGRGIFAAEIDRVARRRALWVALLTGAMFGLSTYLFVFALEKAGSVSAAIAIQAYPLFAILWETLFLRRRKTPLELLLTAILIGALYFLGTEGTWRIEGFSPWFFVALGVPFLWSVAHVIIKEELGRTPVTPAQVTFFRVALSTVFLGAAMLLIAPGVLTDALLRADFQLFAALMGAVYYLELILWFYAVRHIDVSLASAIVTPWPALTMALAALLLGEATEPYQIGAFLVIAASIYGLIAAGLRKARRTSPAP